MANDKDITRAFNKGVRQGKYRMKNDILKEIKSLNFVGEKRYKDVYELVNKIYDETTY